MQQCNWHRSFGEYNTSLKGKWSEFNPLDLSEHYQNTGIVQSCVKKRKSCKGIKTTRLKKEEKQSYRNFSVFGGSCQHGVFPCGHSK
jgi:hypothetical protein